MSPALAAIWAFWWLLAVTAPIFFIVWALLGIRRRPKNFWLFLAASIPAFMLIVLFLVLVVVALALTSYGVGQSHFASL